MTTKKDFKKGISKVPEESKQYTADILFEPRKNDISELINTLNLFDSAAPSQQELLKPPITTEKAGKQSTPTFSRPVLDGQGNSPTHT